jgi:20S proteasome alpha/beta subunit
MSSSNIEVGVVREDRKFHVLTAAQVKEYLDELNWSICCKAYNERTNYTHK